MMFACSIKDIEPVLSAHERVGKVHLCKSGCRVRYCQHKVRDFASASVVGCCLGAVLKVAGVMHDVCVGV